MQDEDIQTFSLFLTTMFRYLSELILLVFVASCTPATFSPKPTGYYKMDTPARHTYRVFDEQGYPYKFEYPTFGHVEKDTLSQKEKLGNPYWINVVFPSFRGVINITYIEISKERTLQALLSDADELSNFHNKKADYIDQHPFKTPGGIYGVIYEIGGNSASRYQFFATDSVKHFLRGSLYFDTTPNADSLRPATDFLQRDIIYMMYTLRWKNGNEPTDNPHDDQKKGMELSTLPASGSTPNANFRRGDKK